VIRGKPAVVDRRPMIRLIVFGFMALPSGHVNTRSKSTPAVGHPVPILRRSSDCSAFRRRRAFTVSGSRATVDLARGRLVGPNGSGRLVRVRYELTGNGGRGSGEIHRRPAETGDLTTTRPGVGHDLDETDGEVAASRHEVEEPGDFRRGPVRPVWARSRSPATTTRRAGLRTS
jgi:hypothetical protein